MLIKIEFIIAICYISGVWMQNPACRQFDFNDLEEDLLVHFTQCQSGNIFVIASYEDTDIVPFRSDSEFYLTNYEPGVSCFRTTQLFNLDNNTEIDAAIFLHSISNDESVFVDIIISDSANGVHLVGESIVTSNEWTQFSSKVDLIGDNATVEIRANLTEDTTLAIEYIYVVNSKKAEIYCRRPITTTAATSDTTEPTDEITATTDTTATTSTSTDTTSTTDTTASSVTTTDTSSTTATPSNGGVLWIALSFTFFLTTFIVAAALIYVIYLYKAAIFMKNSLLMASTTAPPSSLPRLTITNSIHGNQVIVGIERTYNNAAMISKH